jgi:hypothetical protein
LQNLQIPGYGAQQGREQTVLHHLQLLWIASFGHGHQDWFLCTGRQAQETTGLECALGYFLGFLFGVLGFYGRRGINIKDAFM